MANNPGSLFPRLREWYSSEIPHEKVDSILASQRSDGTWSGPEYHKKGHTPIEHLKNASTLAEHFGYACGVSPASHECQNIRSAVIKSLDYWFSRQKDFVSDNWWMNEIGIQREMAPIAFSMWKEFSETQKSQIVKVFPTEPSGNGTNRTWISELVVVRGILEGRDSLVRLGLQNIESTMLVTDKEGHQRDHSFFMHGNQLYNGGYGKMALSTASKWAAICRGTPYAFRQETLEAMSDLALEGNRWMMWMGTMDAMTMGREISRKGNKDALGHLSIVDNLSQVDSAHVAEYKAWREEIYGGNFLSGCRYFDRGEMMVCRSSDYYASLKMSSKNTVGSESINRENRKGFWLGAGVLSVYRHYDDFRNIYPLWDWSMLPGITSYNKSEQKEKRVTNSSEMVGGFADGSYGVAYMTLDRSEVFARKAWLFLDGKIVALGNSIAGYSADEIVTSVDQRLAHTDVLLDQRPLPDDTTKVSLNVWHDSIAYRDLEKNGFAVEQHWQKGNWKDIGTDKKQESAKILKIWKIHGKNPRTATYAYEMDLNVLPQDFPNKMESPIRVVQNDSVAQVIFDEERNVWAGVVFEPTVISYNETKMSFDAPCMFVQKDDARKIKGLKLK